MDKSKIDKQDDDLRKIFAGTKVRASENLKYRIMQQIETESVFTRKKAESKNIVTSIRGVVSVLGVMYLLISLVCVGIFLTGGIEALTSLEYFIPVIMISLVCCTFLLITVLDDKRHYKSTSSSTSSSSPS